MQKQTTSQDLELLILSSLLHTPHTSASRRTLAETFQTLITVLTQAKVEYVLAGAMALGLYAKARYTKDIDLIALDSEAKKITSILTQAGFKLLSDLPYQLTLQDPTNKVEVDILLGALDPEQSAVEDPAKARVFQTPTLLIKPEYLLWMYCLSDQPKHEVDAIELIKSGKVDLKKFSRYLDYAQDDAAREQYHEIFQKLTRTRSSYSSQMAKRIITKPLSKA